MTTGCSVSPERPPSVEIQKTKEWLMTAVQKRLPPSLADHEGITVRQKNTFFHVELDDYCNDYSDSSLDSSEAMSSGAASLESSPLPVGRFLSGVSPIPPLRTPTPEHQYNNNHNNNFDVTSVTSSRRSPPRKQTESCIPVPPSLTRRSSISAPASQRCHSCPPTAPPSPLAPVDNHGISLVDNSNATSPSPPPLPREEPLAKVPLPLLELLPEFSTAAPAPPVLVVQPPAPPSVSSRTTVMLRNVPYHESQTGVLDVVEARGFQGKFDFFYAPLDFASGNNLGYCFINLRSPEAVAEFFKTFDNLRVNEEGWSMKQLAVCWARVQGLSANIEQYRNSPVNEMPVRFKPMLFDEYGDPLPFPAPDVTRPGNHHPRGSLSNSSQHMQTFGPGHGGSGAYHRGGGGGSHHQYNHNQYNGGAAAYGRGGYGGTRRLSYQQQTLSGTTPRRQSMHSDTNHN